MRAGLCYTIPLMIPSGLQPSDPAATIFNSQEKAYQDDKDFGKSCNLKATQLIYEHQQKEHIKLMSELQQVPLEYLPLPFHHCILNSMPIHVLKTQAHEMIWHQQLIHLSSATLQSVYKYCDGIPNLPNFSFDDIKNCLTCIKANMRKNAASKRSLTKSVTRPYQDLFIDFGFSGYISYDKDGKVVPSSWAHVEGVNGESVRIFICDPQTKILHGDCQYVKISLLCLIKTESFFFISQVWI